MAPSDAAWRPSRGWYSVATWLLLVAVATLGLGFYWPLHKAYDLLATELNAEQRANDQLSQSHRDVEARLAKVESEREHLQEFKAALERARQRYAEMPAQLRELAQEPLRSELESGSLQPEATRRGLRVSFADRRLLTPTGSELAWRGRRLLCPLVVAGRALGATQIVVRAGLATNGKRPAATSAWRKATRRATAVAALLPKLCDLSGSSVSVAAAPSAESAPLLQLELYSPNELTEPSQ